MGKNKHINKKNNPFIWRYRSFKNWFYDKWMRLHGYMPTTFNFYDNKYNYEKRSKVKKLDSNEQLQIIHVKEKELLNEIDNIFGTQHKTKNKRLRHAKLLKLKELRNE